MRSPGTGAGARVRMVGTRRPGSRGEASRTASGQLVFWTCFNALPLSSERSDPTWTAERFRHWRAFTLTSILRQEHPTFEYWLVCDRELEHLTAPWASALGDDRVRLVHTDEWAERRSRLPVHDRALFARIDSDDLYHPRVAGHLLRHDTTRDFLQFNHGYACDVGSGAVYDWRSRSSPFYCRVERGPFRADEPFGVVDHTTVGPRATVLGPGHFLVMLHGRNTSTRAPRRGRHRPGAARDVLARFGVGGRQRLAQLAGDRADLRARAIGVPDARIEARSGRSIEDRSGPWSEARSGPSTRARSDELRRTARARYIVEVEPTPAVSEESAALFGWLGAATRAARVLDLGAGFGAIAARCYSVGAAPDLPVTCHSVDARPSHRRAVMALLSELGLEQLGAWTTAEDVEPRSYDLVLCDLSRVGAQGLVTAIRAVAPAGLVLVVGIEVEHERSLEAQLAPYLFDEYPEVDRRPAPARSAGEGDVADPGARSGVRLLGRIVGPFLDAGTARR